MLRNVFMSVLVSGMALLLPMQVQAAPSVDLATRAEVERNVPDGKGSIKKVLVHASKAEVVPGDIVIFTTVYRNAGDAPTDAGLTIDNPVPEYMLYIENSAGGSDTSITFSVDGGKSFDVPSRLYVIDKDGKKRQATTADYTHIRWTRFKPLAPGAEESVGFRAKVK